MRRFVCLLAVVLVVTPVAADAPRTREEIEAFMRTAKVVRQRDAPKGITRPLRLTLSDGEFTHDAAFQPIDEKKTLFQPDRGPAEVNFVDSWRYNVAAYRLAHLLDLQEMMPPTIEYRYNGKTGALAWWMDSLMDEGQRLKKKVQPPNPTAWNYDMYRQRVFNELVHDTDRNLGNVLISPEWRVIMIDFTRAFRLWEKIRPGELQRCDRALLAKLESLSGDAVTEATKSYLAASEVKALMKRRDLIVAHFKELVAKRGEDKVLY
jgi:hypothetical protein